MQLDTVRIFVSDVNRSKQFYEDVLGLNLETDGSEDGFLVFCSGSVKILIENSESADETTGELLIGRFTGISFKVPNIYKSYETLISSGVDFLDPPQKQPWGGLIASFKDIDNNILTIVQSPS